MREKYIEEMFPRYFEFGMNQTGLVDVSSSKLDPVVTVTREQAKVLIDDRDKIVDRLVKVCQAFDNVNPEAFKSVWYE